MPEVRLFDDSNVLYEFESPENLEHVETLKNLVENTTDGSSSHIILGKNFGLIPKDQPSYIPKRQEYPENSKDPKNSTLYNQNVYLISIKQLKIEIICEYLLNQETNIKDKELNAQDIVEYINICILFGMKDIYLDHLIMEFLLSTDIKSIFNKDIQHIRKKIENYFDPEEKKSTLYSLLTNVKTKFMSFLPDRLKYKETTETTKTTNPNYFIEFIIDNYEPYMKWMHETSTEDVRKNMNFSMWTEILTKNKLLEVLKLPKTVIEKIFTSAPEKENITSIYIPEGINIIEKYIFNDFPNLFRLQIPHTCINIEEEAFDNCNKLEYVFIPPSIEKIGEKAFANCSKLTRVDINSDNVIIEKNAFLNCSYLTNVKIHKIDNFKEIFPHCSNLTINSSVKIINNNAFSECSQLINVTINCPELTTIGKEAFSKCSQLINVTINCPELTTIGERAFYQCKELKKINIPISVTNIGKEAFNVCWGLRDGGKNKN
jgi:hypothetical protein